MHRVTKLGVVLGTATALVFFPGSIAMAAPTIDDDGIVWIYGQATRGYSCWTKGSDNIRLQMRDERGKWQTVATGKARKKSKQCSGKYPVKMEYLFIVSELGSRQAPKSRGYLTQVREVTSSGRAYPFTKIVYATKQDHVADLRDAFCEVLTGKPC